MPLYLLVLTGYTGSVGKLEVKLRTMQSESISPRVTTTHAGRFNLDLFGKQGLLCFTSILLHGHISHLTTGVNAQRRGDLRLNLLVFTAGSTGLCLTIFIYIYIYSPNIQIYCQRLCGYQDYSWDLGNTEEFPTAQHNSINTS